MVILWGILTASIGCQVASRGGADSGDVPSQAARRSQGAPGAQGSRVGAAGDVPVDEFLIEQIKAYGERLPETIIMGEPEILWFEGPAGKREGVAVVLLVRKDVYVSLTPSPSAGPAAKVLVDLMSRVGGHVTNLHRVEEAERANAREGRGTLAQKAYEVLKSVGSTGRIQNANRWIITSFVESDDPIEAFRPFFDQFWSACVSLRASEPVLIVGDQVLGRDDLMLRRLYRKAGRTLDWPTHAGSAPDPGLQFSPKKATP